MQRSGPFALRDRPSQGLQRKRMSRQKWRTQAEERELSISCDPDLCQSSWCPGPRREGGTRSQQESRDAACPSSWARATGRRGKASLPTQHLEESHQVRVESADTAGEGRTAGGTKPVAGCLGPGSSWDPQSLRGLLKGTVRQAAIRLWPCSRENSCRRNFRTARKISDSFFKCLYWSSCLSC